MDEPLYGMDDDRHRKRDQEDSVEKGGQDLGALPTISQHVRFGMLGDTDGVECHDKC